MAKIKIPFLPGILINYIYSLIISFSIIMYFRKKEKTNIFIILITSFHLSFLFFMPTLAFMSCDPQNCAIEVKLDIIIKIIEIISYINYFLSFIFYPLTEIYIKSGYFSLINIYIKVSILDYIFKYSIYPGIIIIAIIYIIFKDFILSFYNNYLIFLLNYLNILKLISIYFEVGFCYGAFTRYCYKIFCRKEEYIPYILGKIFFDEIAIKKKFKKQYNKLLQINADYLENNQNIILEKDQKLYVNMKKEINKYIQEINSIEYLENIHLDKRSDNINNINVKELELKLGKPFQKCKYLKRQLERINNIRIEKINIKRGLSSNCCICCKCCKSRCCEITRFILFAFICLAVVSAEYSYYEKYSSESFSYKNNTKIFNDLIYNNDTKNDNDNSSNNETISIIAAYIIVCPLDIIANFVIFGFYIFLIFYSILNRKYISGDFFYGKNNSDNLNLIYSVNTLTGSIVALLYLGTLYYITMVKKEKYFIGKDNPYLFLDLLKIPHMQIVLYLRYIFILICCLITRVLEKINIQLIKCFFCCKFLFCCNCCSKACKKKIKIDICDECSFEPRDREPCCRKLLEGNRNKYIEKGKEEEIRLVISNDMNYYMLNNI